MRTLLENMLYLTIFLPLSTLRGSRKKLKIWDLVPKVGLNFINIINCPTKFNMILHGDICLAELTVGGSKFRPNLAESVLN